MIRYFLDDHDSVSAIVPRFCKFHIRGDASFVLMEMIQQSLMTQFERGNLIVAHQQQPNHAPHPYPVLTLNSMNLQGMLQQEDFSTKKQASCRTMQTTSRCGRRMMK